MPEIIVYTDGSCIGNPGPGGWAFLVLEKNKIVKKTSGLDYQTTNNRMEMTALLEALIYLAKNYSKQSIKIFSDSNLLVQTINQGWKKKANQDLWQKIDQFRVSLNYKLEWVKAHHLDPHNNLCDELAQSAALKAQKAIQKNPQLIKELPLSPITKAVPNNQTALF